MCSREKTRTEKKTFICCRFFFVFQSIVTGLGVVVVVIHIVVVVVQAVVVVDVVVVTHAVVVVVVTQAVVVVAVTQAVVVVGVVAPQPGAPGMLQNAVLCLKALN